MLTATNEGARTSGVTRIVAALATECQGLSTSLDAYVVAFEPYTRGTLWNIMDSTDFRTSFEASVRPLLAKVGGSGASKKR